MLNGFKSFFLVFLSDKWQPLIFLCVVKLTTIIINMVNFITKTQSKALNVLFFSLLSVNFALSQSKDTTDSFVPKQATSYTDSNYQKNLNKANKEQFKEESTPRMTSEERLKAYRRRLQELDASSEEYLHIKFKIQKIENSL